MDFGRVPGEIGTIPDHREVIGTPREVYGPYWAVMGERRREPRRGRAPQAQSELGGGSAPLSFLILPLPSSPTPTRERGGLLLLGVGLPLGRAIERAGAPLLPSFIYGGGGHPIDTQVDNCLSHVRCPPPPYSTSVISSRSLGEALRR